MTQELIKTNGTLTIKNPVELVDALQKLSEAMCYFMDNGVWLDGEERIDKKAWQIVRAVCESVK